MKILLFSDLHAHEFADFSHTDPKTGLNSRLNWCVRVINRVRREVGKRGIEHVVFGGDLFHVRGVVRVPVIQAIGSAFFRLARVAQVTIAAGNHDQADKEGRHVASSVLSRKNITVVDTWKVIEGLPDTAVFAYDWNPDRFRENLRIARERGVRHLVVHAGIHGAQTGTRDFIPREEIKPEEFDPFRRVFSGHYHKHQDLTPVVTYIGAALQQYRSESNYRTGFIVYDYETNTYEHVRIRTPRFVRWEGNRSDDKRVKGNYVDAVVPEGWSVEGVQKHLEDLQAAAFNIIPPDHEPSRQTEQRLQIDTSTDRIDMLKKYAEEFHGELDLKKLIDMGVSLASE